MYTAARAARAAQLQAFDSRLQGVARVKQLLPPGFRLPLPALCLLARSLVFHSIILTCAAITLLQQVTNTSISCSLAKDSAPRKADCSTYEHIFLQE